MCDYTCVSVTVLLFPTVTGTTSGDSSRVGLCVIVSCSHKHIQTLSHTIIYSDILTVNAKPEMPTEKQRNSHKNTQSQSLVLCLFFMNSGLICLSTYSKCPPSMSL